MQEDNSQNVQVELQKLRGEVEKVNLKFDNFAATNNVTTAQIMANTRKLENKVDTKVFEEYVNNTKPLFDWVESRISQEKLIIGVLGFIGFSNVVLMLYVILNSLYNHTP